METYSESPQKVVGGYRTYSFTPTSLPEIKENNFDLRHLAKICLKSKIN